MTIPSNQPSSFAQPTSGAPHLGAKTMSAPGSAAPTGVTMARQNAVANFHPYSGYPSPQQHFGPIKGQPISSVAPFHPMTSPAMSSSHYMITPAPSPVVGDSPHNPAADSFETFKNLLTQSFPEMAQMDQDTPMPPPPAALFVEDNPRHRADQAGLELMDDFRQSTPVSLANSLVHPSIVDDMIMSTQYFSNPAHYQQRYTLPLQQSVYQQTAGMNSHPAAFMAAHQANAYPMNTNVLSHRVDYPRQANPRFHPSMLQHSHPYSPSYHDLMNDAYARPNMYSYPTTSQEKTESDKKPLKRASESNDMRNARRPAVKPITVDFTHIPPSEPSPPPTPLTPEEEEQRALAKILERPNPVPRPMNPAELATLPRFKCACTKQFQKLCGLKSHIKVHQSQGERLRYNDQGELEWFNAEGKAVTASPQDLVRSHVCDQCKRSFLRRQDLRRHLVSAHSDNMKKLHCPNCDATFSRSDALYRHIHSNRCRV